MFTCNHYSFRLGDILFFLRAALHPLAGILTPKKAELVSAPTTNTAESMSWKLRIIFEFQPINETFLVTVRVHRLEQGLAIQRPQRVRAELLAECCVALLQLLRRQEVTPASNSFKCSTESLVNARVQLVHDFCILPFSCRVAFSGVVPNKPQM